MSPRTIDGHVHIVGDGSSGSGCWLTLTGVWMRFLVGTMIRELRLPESVIGGGLDELYVDRLLTQVRESSLDAILILAQEAPRYHDGSIIKGKGAFYVPNDYILELCDRHPEFVPAVSVHPARRDALDELEKCIAGGARVMKCLPNCQNIDCGDKRYEPFWERMAEAKMVLLAHTGGEMTLPVINSGYADPKTLGFPLECGVTVIAAHCSGRSCLHDPDYTDSFIAMLGKFPNLYGDNSALCSPIRSRTIKKVLRPGVVERIIHGSDYPIPVSGLGPWMRGRLRWCYFRQGRSEPNVIQRDAMLKRAMGFPEDTFTRLDGLLGGE